MSVLDCRKIQRFGGDTASIFSSEGAGSMFLRNVGFNGPCKHFRRKGSQHYLMHDPEIGCKNIQCFFLNRNQHSLNSFQIHEEVAVDK